MQQLWERLSTSARIGLAVGCLLILGLVAGLATWAYRPNYQILFADMAPRDAAAMAAELDKLKTPYRLADNGNTILVPRDLVYKTRLQVMGKEIPLQGAVGFEVFNNADFGVTDFVQKVNYQRAVQGELTRTILSIDGVATARVHLAIPDQGLFKKAVTKPKASVTVAMKPGHALVSEQVQGIQRLVAASVPDMVGADVTVLDQQGIALTRPGSADGGGEGAVAQLDSKRSAEDYLYKKVAQVLDRTFGPGEAIASVDLVLNLDQHKLTTEEVLPARAATADAGPAGVVVRERHVSREGEGSAAQAGATTTDEADYQVGRRVEQLSTASGTIKRMTVAVVVKKPLSDEQLARLREVVAVATGFNQVRGDAIVVSTLGSLVSQAAPASEGPAPAAGAALPPPAAATNGTTNGGLATKPDWTPAWLLALLPLAAAGALAWRRSRAVPAPRLGEHERARLVTEVRQWIDVPSVVVVEQK